MSFRQIGPAMMTTCWPISRPAVENCKISERLFSFRTTNRHGSPCPNRPPWLPRSKLIYLYLRPNQGSMSTGQPCKHNIIFRALSPVSPSIRLTRGFSAVPAGTNFRPQARGYACVIYLELPTARYPRTQISPESQYGGLRPASSPLHRRRVRPANWTDRTAASR